MIIATKKKLVSSVLAFSLLTTSFGSVFAASAYANMPDSTVAESIETEPSRKDLLIGLAAVGLIAALANNGNNDKAPAQDSNNSESDNTSTSGGTVLTAQGQQALALLNNDRAKYGLPALKANSQLTRLAEDYAQDMIKRGYFSHNNPEGQTPFARMRAAGISYRTAGENLAINTSVVAAQKSFMNSSGHRANVLNSSYTDVGIGVVQNSSGQLYVVQEFISK